MTLDNLILRNKCIILGNCGVGKSAISQVFHSDGQFPKNYTPTIHEEIYVKMMNIVDNQNINVELFIHDVSGHDLFNEFLPKYVN
ncbi:Intraflagellar transport protein 27 [Clydaea vesicula]|uniref:Intraflagellar transport protein 27 n=1 Tax=Clydaea vesicula TaxID=447962 RepID=A0AAD5XXX6_9FUNG|nr:Intraflagellar transport protein 27 [Clydaea vesicula]